MDWNRLLESKKKCKQCNVMSLNIEGGVCRPCRKINTGSLVSDPQAIELFKNADFVPIPINVFIAEMEKRKSATSDHAQSEFDALSYYKDVGKQSCARCGSKCVEIDFVVAKSFVGHRIHCLSCRTHIYKVDQINTGNKFPWGTI